jgi:methionyl-tRNA synthetase
METTQSTREEKSYLITSALPYINGVKHLGNLVGSILPADVYSRFLRQQGKKVLYICGTDEHGTPAELAAVEAQEPIESYCQRMHVVQKELCEKFHIVFDYFGRTSSVSNHILSQGIFKSLKQEGYVHERSIQQYYSLEDKRFLPDRYIEGICPKCSYEKARGDQCDQCGALLDPTDLIEPFSATSGSRHLQLQETKHFFLDLKPLELRIQSWLDSKKDWPNIVTSIAYKWIKEGLKERCITRDLRWGIQVPEAGFENKVFYVWFDAPNGYISITQDWAQSLGKPDAWKTWWLENASEPVTYVQFMGKDNVPFHAVFWPGVLFGSALGFRQVDYIKSFHWLTYEGGKFSTSYKRGVFMDVALDLYPADYWRYYLMAQCPETDDADFTFQHFAAVINKDLADVLGNFVQRVLSLWHRFFQGVVPKDLLPQEIDSQLFSQVRERIDGVYSSFYHLHFRLALQNIRSLWALGNEYITQKEPWHLFKNGQKEEGLLVLLHGLYLIRCCAFAGYCVIPKASQKIMELLNLSDNPGANCLKGDGNMPQNCQGQTDPCNLFGPYSISLDWSAFPPGHTLKIPEPLFQKISDEEVDSLTKRFAGTHQV